MVNPSIGVESPSRTAIDQNVLTFVARYRSLLKKSGGSIIEQAKTIHEVETELGKKHQASFYRQIGLDPEGATVRKLRVIGENSPRFQPFLDRIPSTWTTLYDLAKLSMDDFKRVTDADLLTPFVTAKEIRELVRGKAHQDAEPRRKARVTIDLAAAKDGKRLFAEISRLTREFGVDLIVDPEAKKQFALAGEEL